MKFVLDASVGAKAALPELDSDKAIILLDQYRSGLLDVMAPDFYPIEVVHSITRAERQGRITRTEGMAALQYLLPLLPAMQVSLPLVPRAYEISSQARIGVHDCIYLALAERERCELVTADEKLVRNLQGQFPFIRSLATLP